MRARIRMSILDLLARRPLTILTAAAVVTGLAVIPAQRLRLDTDLAALLPTGSRAADDYRVFLDHFGGMERVFVLVVPPTAGHPDELADALEELAESLESSPEIRTARCGIRPEDERFILDQIAPRAALLGPEHLMGQLTRLTTEAGAVAAARQIRAELLSPTGALTAPLLRSDPLGLARELDALDPGADLPIEPLSLTFQTADAAVGLILVTPTQSEIDAGGGRALAARISAASSALQTSHGPDWRLEAVGGPLYAAHDEAILRQDLQGTLGASAAACLGLLWIVLGGWREPLAIITGLAAGLVLTAAAISGVGAVSAVSIGLAAVLVGLGLDYGIHIAGRVKQLRPTVAGTGAAVVEACRTTAPGIVASAMTTAAGFGVLALAHFRPLRETGLLVSIGIASILAATVFVTAPGMILLGPGPAGPSRAWRRIDGWLRGVVRLAVGRPRTTLALLAVVSAAAAAGALRLTVDPDPAGLRPVDHPTLRAERILSDSFGIGLDTATVVLNAPTLDEVLDRSDAVERVIATALGDTATIASPSRWLPSSSTVRDRLELAKSLHLEGSADRLRAAMIASDLDPTAFETGLGALAALANGRDPAPTPPPSQWPDWLRELVHLEADGAWATVRVRLPGGSWPDGPPAALVRAVEQVAPGSAIASAGALGRDLKQLAKDDLRRLGGAAVLAVLAVVAISFRGRVRPAIMAMLPVSVGTLWALGIWGALGRPLGLLELAVLPILLGIGIDDGLHAVHSSIHGGVGLADAVVSIGPSMTLTSLTTCLGFGSLGLSHVPALRAIAILVPVGVLACLVTTVALLPAMASVTIQKR